MATATAKRRVKHNRKPNAWEKRLANKVVVMIAAVNLTILAVSLEHLATGISAITHAPTWAGWALAIAIDVGMIAAEVSAIALGTVVPTAIAFAHRYVVATIGVSMILNVMAFWTPDGSLFQKGMAILLGVAIPAGVWTLTRTAGQIWMNCNRGRGR